MANPLSDRGWSDRDYAAAIGTLVGEAAVKGGLQDFQAIADVIANRAQAGVYGRTISGITMDPSQFSTWSPKEKGAFANAKAGFAAALNPQRAASFSPAMRDRVEMAKQAVDDVFVNGKARGLTQGATAYHNPSVTAKLGTDGWHKGLEDDYGYVDIGAHRFTGKGFNPDQPFDPITYNGQLAAPPSVDPFLGDIGVPIGQVAALGPVPDLTPQQPASAGSFFGGFDISDVTLPSDTYNDIMGGFALNDFAPIDAAPVDFSGVRQGMTEQQAIDAWGLGDQRLSENVEVRPGTPGFGEDVDMASRYREDLNSTYDVQAGLYSHELAGFGTQYDGTPPVAAMATRNLGYDDPWSSPAVDFSDITTDILHDGATYPDITADLYGPTSMPDVSPSAGMIPGSASIMDATGFNTGWDAAPPTGFSAGFNEGPWGATPDFDAPSLAARNNVDKFDGAMAVRNQSTPTNEDIAASVMAELSPSAPQLSTPSFDPQAAALGDWADKVSPSGLSTPSVSTQAAPTRTAGPTSTSPQGDFAAPERVSRSPSLSAPTPPSRPAEAAPALPSATPSFTDTVLDGLGLSAPINSVKSGLSDVFGSSTDFVNAMSNPQIAENYTPGLFDGWTGDVITGAAMGALTGGPFGALTGGLFGGLNIGGRIGSHLSNANGGLFGGGFGGFLDTMSNPFAGMSPQDIAAYGLDGDWTTREPTMNTGMTGGYDGRGGGVRGDGSYSESSGRNDNNPQGIL